MCRIDCWNHHNQGVPIEPESRHRPRGPVTAMRLPAVPFAVPARSRSSVMSLPTSPGPAPVESGARRATWWGNRGVRTKVLVAVAIASLVAVVIGVLGLFSLDSAAARTQNLYDANLQGITNAETMAGALKDTRVTVRDVILAADAATAQQTVALIDTD